MLAVAVSVSQRSNVGRFKKRDKARIPRSGAIHTHKVRSLLQPQSGLLNMAGF
uniref:Uncharacterized protein n=1 Tax=Helianthus annuus TaxID=4232 RepID=A0A251U168_HELAN